MNDQRLLLGLKARVCARTLAAVWRQPLITTTVVGVCILLWIFGSSYAVYKGVRFMDAFPGIGDYLVGKLFAIFTGGVSLMLVCSCAILAYPLLFARQENTLLLSLPLAPSAIISCKLWETIIMGSWAYLLMAAPLMLAYFIAGGLGAGLFVLSWLFFLPLVVICGALGMIGALLCGRLFPGGGRRRAWLMVAALAAAALYFGRSRGAGPGGVDQTLRFLNTIVARCELAGWFLLPGSWVAGGIRGVGDGRYREALFFWLLLASNAIFLFSLSCFLGERMLIVAWDRIRSAGAAADPRVRRSRIFARRSPLAAVVSKDLISFIRDPGQWAQFVLFFGLLGIYLLNLRNLPYNLENLFWRYLLFFLNLSAMAFVLAGLSSRFFFPLVSLELKRLWFIGLTPFGAGRLVREKFLLCVVFAVGVTLLLALLSGFMLRIAPLLIAYSLVAVALMGVAISGLSVGLGAIYPNLRASSSAEVVSGLGGTMVLIANVGYVCVALLIEAIPLVLHVKGTVGDAGLVWCIGGSVCVLGIVSAAAALLTLRAGRRVLETIEL